MTRVDTADRRQVSSSDGAAARLERMACRYRTELGWPVEAIDIGLWLSLRAGVVGLQAPLSKVDTIQERVRHHGCAGPVLLMPTWPAGAVFLGDANDLVVSNDDLPLGAQILRAPTILPLPTGLDGMESVRWRYPPRPDSPWLPSLATLVVAAADAYDHL